jgi:hypothetical protein
MISPRTIRYQNEMGEPIAKPATPYDERVIPTLRKNNNTSRLDKSIDNGHEAGGKNSLNNNAASMRISEEDTGEAVMNSEQQLNTESMEPETYDPMDGTEEMTEREVREAALMNDFLGKQIVSECFLSKTASRPNLSGQNRFFSKKSYTL